eukprot:Polyplicarium_translucidae@DN1495_c0_g1_i1.p1
MMLTLNDYLEWGPFYLIQQNLEAKERQLELWNAHILNYCATQREFILSLNDHTLGKAPFYNTRISRGLNMDGLTEVLESLVNRGAGMWLSEDSHDDRRIGVLWKTVSEWADDIWSWAKDMGKMQSRIPLSSLVSDKPNSKEDFYGMPVEMLKLVMVDLQKRGFAEIVEGGEVVRFFNP